MNLTIVEPPRTTALTTLARMRVELGLAVTDTSKDDRLTPLIEEASADVIGYIQQPLIRQLVTEDMVGYGRTVQVLGVTPVPKYGVSEVRLRGDAIDTSEYYVSDPEAGFVFRGQRWDDSRPMKLNIEIEPALMPGDQAWAFDYAGGYILPGDDISPSGTVAVDHDEQSFSLTGDTFPILVSGEFFRTTGFGLTANNGRHRVLSRTPTKLIVSTALLSEAPSGTVNFFFRNLPKDLEGFVVKEVKFRYQRQLRDLSITGEKLGDWAVEYVGKKAVDPTELANGGLFPEVARGLDRYVRVE